MTPFPQKKRSLPGLVYLPGYLRAGDRKQILLYLRGLRPLWEQRYSPHRPPPPGEEQRQLLRPVYWLGNWQFACLGYFHPPITTDHCCVKAEPYPPVLQGIVNDIQKRVLRIFRKQDIPSGWKLNTCLINFYGNSQQGEKWVDAARVGEHKDFEPGPVASLSMGERAFFQFVQSGGRGKPSRVVYQQWLEDGALQIFGGPLLKDKLFHRVQRVEKKSGQTFPPEIERFQTRRINFTFRYVPEKYLIRWSELPAPLRSDIQGYVEKLAESSAFFRRELDAIPCSSP